MLPLKMERNSFILCLWSSIAMLIAVSTATPTSLSGDTLNNEYDSTTESGYTTDREGKYDIEQVKTNSINPNLHRRYKFKSVEYECGVIEDDVRQSPDTKYICNFYNHIMKTNNDFTEIKDSLEKCYGFLCSWYKAACNSDENTKTHLDLENLKERQGKCACMLKFWRKYSCAKVFNNGDVFEEENIESIDSDEQNKNVEEKTKEESNIDLGMLRKKRQADDSITFGDPEEIATVQASVSDVILQRYSSVERNCFAEMKIRFGGACQSLAMKGPCGTGQWLVLQKPSGPEPRDNTPRPVCKTKPCTAMDEVWWPMLGRCIKKTMAKSMGCEGEQYKIGVDLFGDGVCQCTPGYGMLKNDNGCYMYYQQGPCDFGQVVTYDRATGFAVCTADLCAKENNESADRSKRSNEDNDGTSEGNGNHHVSHYGNTAIKKQQIDAEKYNLLGLNRDKRENLIDAVGLYDKDLMKIVPNEYHSEGVHKTHASVSDERIRIRRQADSGFNYDSNKKLFAPTNGNGTCYKLGSSCESVGPNSRFVINSDTRLPSCSKNLQLHLIDGAPKCKADENNMCRDVVQVKQESDLDFYLHMMNQMKSKRDTRRQG